MCTKGMRQGVTLIELVVAIVILAVFLYMATSLSGTMIARVAAQGEVLAVEGAFRAAGETIVQDGRRAGWPNNVNGASPVLPAYAGGSGSSPYIVLPIEGSLDDELAITIPVNGIMHLYCYYLDTSSGASHVVCADYRIEQAGADSAALSSWDPTTWRHEGSGLTLPSHDGLTFQSADPITSSLTQLTHLYFVRRAGTVTMVFTARFVSGHVHEATYMTNLFIRNYVVNPSSQGN